MWAHGKAAFNPVMQGGDLRLENAVVEQAAVVDGQRCVAPGLAWHHHQASLGAADQCIPEPDGQLIGDRRSGHLWRVGDPHGQRLAVGAERDCWPLREYMH